MRPSRRDSGSKRDGPPGPPTRRAVSGHQPGRMATARWCASSSDTFSRKTRDSAS
jgi:hypothetical protein